ncbi:two-partner secretion domain-containing protein [Achromobacter ruhlandii]|uniref:two-partner secretion domain-containing protein n=1 Tax=Achromobacter ruhlandii TaxID=72557 RepID=UPI0007BF6758|nr:hemagglutinin repeat-containing protein [Achromobacter ruhlandii]
MNKNLYRVVFNRAVGLFQVVAEIARRDGPGASRAYVAAAGSRFLATVRPLRVALALAFGQAVIVPLANAQVVTDPGAPGNQRPTVLEAANGVPLVNIQTPSAAGVSRNTYRQFDVDQQGAILNNARTNTQTQLGGWVQGNPWLARGTARVILNEVNTSDPSRLRGYVEVAGDRAQLVIANPAGISCDGCGFINADRATLTTGKPIINGGSLEGYRVAGGAIRVDGKGMDASAANYTDLIARSVEANAGIWARQLQVTTGTNEVSADHGKVQNTAASGDAPAFALDVGALGGMYSQKIVLVGTEHGVGVRNAGTLGAQAGQLVVTADGRLENSGTMQARTDTRIDASGGLANAGTVSAGRELAVSTPKDIDNSNGTLNARRIEANAQSLKNRGGAIEQTGTQDMALHAARLSNRDGGRVGLAAADTGATPDSGGNTGNGSGTGGEADGKAGGTGSGAPAEGTGHGGQPGAGVAPLASGLLNIASALDNDGGRILAGGDIDVTARAGLNNDGGHLGARRLDVSGGDLGNRKGEFKVAEARIAAGQLNNDAGLMQLAGPVALSAQDFSNRAGIFQHSDEADTHIKVKGQLDNSEGTLASNAKRLTLDAGQLVNTGGHITHAGDGGLQVNAGAFSGVGGETATAGAATLRLGDGDHRKATFGAARIDLAALSFDNRGGKLFAGGNQANRIDVAGMFDNGNGGTFASNADLDIRAGALRNSEGGILEVGDGRLDIQAQTLRGENATIASHGALSLKGETTDLTGATTRAKAITVNTGTLTTAKGSLVASGGQPLELTVRGAMDNRDGTIAGNGAVDLRAKSLDNARGTVSAAGTDASHFTVTDRLDNTDGALAGNGALALQAGALINRGGTVNAAGPLTAIVRDAVDNRGGRLVSAEDLAVRAGTLVNRDAGLIVSTDGKLDVDTQGRIENAGGTLQGGGDVRMAAAGLGNTGGTVLGANVEVDTRLGSLDNGGGTIASTRGTLSADSGVLNNAGGLLQSAQGMRVDTHGQSLANTGAGNTGGMLSGDALALASGSLDNRGGIVHSQGDALIRSGGIDNTAGQLGGNAHVDITGAALSNGGGRVRAGRDLNVNLSGVADNNAGLMAAGDGLTVSAARILNRDTQGAEANKPLGLQGDSVALSANRIDNTAGAIVADTHVGILGAGMDSVLDNTRGTVTAGGGIEVGVNRALNPLGTLLAGKSLSVTADSLGGDGSLLSKGDSSLILQQDFTNLKEITVNGRARISTAGLLTNRGLLRAGDLEARGANVDNTATGEMSAGRATVVALDTLTNRGLIDGGQARIEAGTLDNVGTGRIHGDHLAIKGGTVSNREEGGRAAVIAARGRLDIGASTLDNREHALIFSAGGGSAALNIGGTLDADTQAAGRASLILNDSATIESLGGLTIDSARLLNRNLHFRTELARISGPTRYLYIQPEGDPEKHDASEYRWEHWSHADRYRHRETGAKIHDWTQYDVKQTEYQTQVIESAPALIRAGGNMTLRGDGLVNDKSRIAASGTLQGDLDRLDNVAAVGEHVIHQTGTSQYTYSRWRGGARRYHQRKWRGKIAYAPEDIATTFDLNVSSVAQHAAGAGSGLTVPDHRDHQVGGAIEGGLVRATGTIGPGQITEVRAGVNNVDSPATVTGPHVTDLNAPVRGPTQGVTGANSDAVTIIRTVQIDTAAPANSLFRTGPDAAGYLIETDPRFADYRNWLSSDYMLSQLGHDPAAVHKRLGDGFYEQKLVRDQIGQLTGRRFLANYASDDAQYQALLDAGVTYAREWNLRPGVALSARQMAQLTSDIVWLVERDVTLDDGSITRALVPQVYVRVQPGDIDGTGTLLAASAIDLNLKGDLVNSGAIAGRAVVNLSGDNLRILGGRITGDAVALSARADIDSIGGTLDAGSTLRLGAGRDLNVVSTTRGGATRAGRSDFSRTNLDRVAGLYVTNPNGLLLASAGRDAKLIAARVGNRGKEGQTAMVAGRDLTLGTVTIAEQENNVRDASNYLRQGYEQDVGSTITTAGDVRLQAGRDLSSTAGAVTSEQGALIAVARGDVNILAGKANRNWAEGHRHSSKSLLGSSTKTTRDSLEETTALSSTFSGNTVAIRGENVTITGSNVVSDAGTAIVANNNLTLLAATETSQESHFKENRKSGFLYNGGLAFTIGSQMQSGDRRDASTHAAASTVGSTAGDVTLAADGHYQQTGSHVLAPKGGIDIQAKKVDIVDARETGKRVEQSKFRQSGLTLAISAPVLSAIETAGQMKRAAGQTNDGRMQVLAGAATGLAAKNAYDAVQADPQSAGGVNISITVGASKSDSKSTATTDTAAGSAVAAGGDVRIDASGGPDSNLTVRGSDIRAGGDAVLKADGDINLLAAQNIIETRRTSSNSSAGVGVAISVGQGGAAMGVTANASIGRGKGEGKDVTWTNSHVTAGERLILGSGGDTRLRGAVASGRQVVADVGGNLSIESLQDISSFKSKDTNVGGSVTVGAGFSGSVNLSQQKIHSDYASVTEQSRIEAGAGGFQIRARDNTDLRGAAITSSEQAVRDGLNTLTTGTLTTSDISNHAEYSASSISVGGGYSSGNGDRKEAGSGGGVGTNQQGQASTGGQVPGSTLPTLGNFSASPPVVMAASGNSGSTTRSGISGAQVTITDEAGQQAASGKSVDEMMAELNREVFTGQDGANALKPIFNEREIRAGFEIVGALQRETGVFLNNRAREAVAAKETLDRELDKPDTERDPARIAALQRQITDSATWAPGGTGRQLLTALTAAVGGNVSASGAQFTRNLVASYVQQQGAGYIGDLVAKGVVKEGSATHAALHAIVACAGASAAGKGCGSGALGAATSSLLTNLFDENPSDNAEQKEAKRNLLATLVTGIASAGGSDASRATSSAISALDNNYLTQGQERRLNEELKACEQRGCSDDEKREVWERWRAISEFQQDQYLNQAVLGCEGRGLSCVTQNYIAASRVAGEGSAIEGESPLTEEIRDYLKFEHSQIRNQALLNGFGEVVNGPRSNQDYAIQASADLLIAGITTAYQSISGESPKPSKPLVSGYDPKSSVKPFAFVEVNGNSYPVYTYEDAKKLPPGTGAIFTTQGGDQRVSSGISTPSGKYDAQTPGAMSDVNSRQRLVFTLRYNNDVTGPSAGGKGFNIVRFDGYELQGNTLIPVDSKNNTHSMYEGSKALRDVTRQQAALNQNGVDAEWHLPTDAKANHAKRNLDLNFGKSSKYPNKITVRTRGKNK